MARIEPFTVSNEHLDQPDKLQEQARQDGYLFFRGLIDEDSISNLRRDFLEICHRSRLGRRRRRSDGRHPNRGAVYGRR